MKIQLDKTTDNKCKKRKQFRLQLCIFSTLLKFSFWFHLDSVAVASQPVPVSPYQIFSLCVNFEFSSLPQIGIGRH